MQEFINKEDGESQWLPISDLMAVLMMVFLLIAVSYMVKVYEEKRKIEEVAITYSKLQNDLYEDLNAEFNDSLQVWNADIDKESLSIKFNAPDILFRNGSAWIKPRFKSILSNFFPRFIEILHNDKYRNDIEEIRIEGHTSSIGKAGQDQDEAYMYNMELSQRRTRNVLEFVLKNSVGRDKLDWTRSNLTANGLSSSRIVVGADGEEDMELSRRVEFRVKTNAEERIAKILGD